MATLRPSCPINREFDLDVAVEIGKTKGMNTATPFSATCIIGIIIFS